MGLERDSVYYDFEFNNDQRYGGVYSELSHFPVMSYLLEWIKKIRAPSIYEIGCGSGQFAQLLWDQKLRDYHGIDFSERAIKIARKLSPQSFEVGDFRLSRISPKFNIVVGIEVLEHIMGDIEFVQRVSEGTNIILSLPNFEDPAHVRLFEKKEDVLKRYGKFLDVYEVQELEFWYALKGVRNGTDHKESRESGWA